MDHGQDECLGVDGLDVSRGSCVCTEVVIPLHSEFGNRLEGSCSPGAFHCQLMRIPYFPGGTRLTVARERLERWSAIDKD